MSPTRPILKINLAVGTMPRQIFLALFVNLFYVRAVYKFVVHAVNPLAVDFFCTSPLGSKIIFYIAWHGICYHNYEKNSIPGNVKKMLPDMELFFGTRVSHRAFLVI